MFILGVDAHKRTHTIVAIGPDGKLLESIVVEATTRGHIEAIEWAGRFAARTWAIEDCRSFSRLLEADLLAHGESGVRVPPKLMAKTRRSLRKRGKSDPIDATSVALGALREPGLAEICLDSQRRDLRHLVDFRDSLVEERTRIQNRIHKDFHELDPTIEIKARSLSRAAVIQRLHCVIGRRDGTLVSIIEHWLSRCEELNEQISQLETEICSFVLDLAPSLLNVVGCAGLSAAKIVAEVGVIERFKSRDAFAMHNGTAPIPVWSSNTENYRLNRSGNRQLNAVIYRIALTQMRCHEPAQKYIEARIANGNSKKKARRALMRHVSNEIYRQLKADETSSVIIEDRPPNRDPALVG